MQFHDYRTTRGPEWRGSTEDYLRWLMKQPCSEESRQLGTIIAAVELSWVTHRRPYYNVYPIAVELCLKTSLGMKWGDVTFPVRSIALRFACGHEPLGISAALLKVPSHAEWSTRTAIHPSRSEAAAWAKRCPLGGNIQTINDSGGLWCYQSPNDLSQEVIRDTVGTASHVLGEDGQMEGFPDKTAFLIRLLAFIGLLSRGTDLITPAILSSDRQEYDTTSDENKKRWLEERARKKLGISFDVGRGLEIERASCPHWRSPHLALFHTGPGRSTPVLKVRSGCVVIPRDMSSVPTGYLGEETAEEISRQAHPPIRFRPAIPKRLRFKVMRRDQYRCRLCGMARDDGVKLEVDHIVPVAKGGRTDERNLWTLCQPCNSGKSDSDLRLAEEGSRCLT